MSLDDDENTWLLALESALYDGCEPHELINITRGRILPEEHRVQIWYICLGGGSKIDKFSHFDEIFDLPEQSTVRSDCTALVDKLGNEEEDKVSIVSDVESIFTHYCKFRHLKYECSKGWADVVTPLLAVKMTTEHMYTCFEEIIEKYIPRDCGKGAAVYHLLRLLLLYHDPDLCAFLDSRRIGPEMFCCSWVQSLFSSVSTLDAVLPLWDIYFQERDPFFILFLSLVILVNSRDQITNMCNEEQEAIVNTLKTIPSGLRVDDVHDFCSLARYYSLKTPSTFRKDFLTTIFGSVYMGICDAPYMVGDLPLSQALCLPISAEEILEVCVQDLTTDTEQVRFFLIDCRPSDQYNCGHLPNAFHLDSSLMLQEPSNFQTAVQGLLLAQKQALSAGSPCCGDHLCFIGSGREAEDQYVHMVVASFLQRGTQYVSLAKGGYQALHQLLVADLGSGLTDHDCQRCIACHPQESLLRQESVDEEVLTSVPKTAQSEPQESSSSFISKFSSAFKVKSAMLKGKVSQIIHKSVLDEEGQLVPYKAKSAEMKGKLIEYITNPTGEVAPVTRHVNPKDKGKLYRKKGGNVFSIHDDDDGLGEGISGDDDNVQSSFEVVTINEYLKMAEVLNSFACHHIRENGYMYVGYIALMEDHLMVLIEGEGIPKGKGHIIAKRALSSIVKITSKKLHPELISFKYGYTLPDGSVTITDIDRFLIPKAGDATKCIKMQILKKTDLVTQ